MKAIILLLAALCGQSVWAAPLAGSIVTRAEDATGVVAIVCTDATGHDCGASSFEITKDHQLVYFTIALEQAEQKFGSECLAEGYIYAEDGQLICCGHEACGEPSAGMSQSIVLKAGAYTLYACKLNCPGSERSNCDPQSVARATVSVAP